MSDSGKALLRQVYEAITRHDMDALADLIADDVVEHEELPGFEPTKDGVLKWFQHMTSAFPDFEMVIHDILSEGDKVSVLGTMTGTQEGEFMDIPPTGNRAKVPFADFFRVENGKVAEHWGVTDTGVMMQQLGQA